MLVLKIRIIWVYIPYISIIYILVQVYDFDSIAFIYVPVTSITIMIFFADKHIISVQYHLFIIRRTIAN